jgi:hypothetical protein
MEKRSRMNQQTSAVAEEIKAIMRAPTEALSTNPMLLGVNIRMLASSRAFDITVRKSLRKGSPRFWWDVTEVAIDEDGAAVDRYDWESDMILYDTPEAAVTSAADLVARVAAGESGRRPGFQA